MPEHARHVIVGMVGPMVYCAGCSAGKLWQPHALQHDVDVDAGRISYPFCGDLRLRHEAARR